MEQIDLQLTAGNNKGNRRELDFYMTERKTHSSRSWVVH